MIRPELDNLTEDQLEYVVHLEGSLSGSSELVAELNLISREIALEVAKIRKKGNILDNEKQFTKVMTLIDKVAKIKSMTAPEKVKKEKEVEEKEPEKEKIAESQDSFFEQKLREKNGR